MDEIDVMDRPTITELANAPDPNYRERERAPGEHHVHGGRPPPITGVVRIGANEIDVDAPSVSGISSVRA